MSKRRRRVLFELAGLGALLLALAWLRLAAGSAEPAAAAVSGAMSAAPATPAAAPLARQPVVEPDPSGAVMTPAPDGVRVRGRALDAASGSPLREFAVAALPELEAADAAAEPIDVIEPADARFTGFVAEDGAFELRVPRAGRYRIAAQAADRLPAAALVDVGPEGAHSVRLLLASGWSLRGRVVDHAGVPVDGAFVELRPLLGGEPLGAAADEAGEVVLPAAPSAHYAVTVLAAGRPTLQLAEFWLDAFSAAQPQRWTLPIGAQVHGVVRAVPPVRGEVVFVHATGAVRRAEVAEDGSFAATGLSPGRHGCRFAPAAGSVRSYVARQRPVDAPDLAVTLRDGESAQVVVDDPTAQLAALAVSVLDHNGVAAAGMQLEVAPVEASWPPALMGALRAQTDAGGAVTLCGVPPGRLRIGCKRDGVEAGFAEVVARPGESASVLIQLR